MKKDEYIKELKKIRLSEHDKLRMRGAIYNANQTIVHVRFPLKTVSLCVLTACLFIVFVINMNKKNNQEIHNPTIGDGHHDIIEYPISPVMWERNDLELINDNPYDLTHPSQTMPIYVNSQKADNAGQEINQLSQKEKEDILIQYAKVLKINQYSFKSSTDVNNSYTLYSELCTIQLEGSSSVFIEFSDEYVQDNQYNMKVNTKDESKHMLEELYLKYQNVFNIKNPAYFVDYHYNIYGDKQWDFQVYEKSDNQNVSLVNFLTQNVHFYENDDGYFYAMRIYTNDISQKVNDFPIITLQQAQNHLLSGNYLSYVYNYQVTDEKDIAYVEMTYRIRKDYDYYLPYYRFYVYAKENDEFEKKTGLKSYVECFVPALNDECVESYYPKEIYFN